MKKIEQYNKLNVHFTNGYYRCEKCIKKDDKNIGICQKEDAIYGHMYYCHKEHILVRGEPLIIWEKNYGQLISRHRCNLCGRNDFTKKDHVVRHLGSKFHKSDLTFLVDIESVRLEISFFQDAGKSKINYKKGIDIFSFLKNNPKDIFEIGFDRNEKPSNSGSNVVPIRRGLNKQKGSICDNYLHYVNCPFIFLEYSATKAEYGINQLIETMKHCSDQGMNVLFGVFIGKKLKTRELGRYKRNAKTWWIEKKTAKKPIKIGEAKIFAGQNGESLNTLLKKISAHGEFNL
ncbi:MAG: hypothetical protein ACXAC5_24205 [Promethearchaeota archaeon]